MLLSVDRRNRLDSANTDPAEHNEFTNLVHRLGCLRGISTLTGSGWQSRPVTGPVSAGHERRVPRAGTDRVLTWAISVPRLDHQDREHSRPPAADRSGIAPPRDLPSRADHPHPVEPGARRARVRGHQSNKRTLADPSQPGGRSSWSRTRQPAMILPSSSSRPTAVPKGGGSDRSLARNSHIANDMLTTAATQQGRKKLIPAHPAGAASRYSLDQPSLNIS